eukprot:sb/3476981/
MHPLEQYVPLVAQLDMSLMMIQFCCDYRDKLRLRIYQDPLLLILIYPESQFVPIITTELYHHETHPLLQYIPYYNTSHTTIQSPTTIHPLVQYIPYYNASPTTIHPLVQYIP